jgi:hypothetical protein
MDGLETMKKRNNTRALTTYLRNHPLVTLLSAKDSRKSPDYSGVELHLLEKIANITLIEDYFVDSSGFGSTGDPAFTYPQFEKILEDLINQKKTEGKKLCSCLTGIGQFQVYVSIFEKKED